VNDWPSVCVLLVTYDRPVEIRRTIAALRHMIVYPGPLNWHICDDGSPAGYLDGIAADFPDLGLTFSVTDRRGWGANVNRGLAATNSRYTFLCEDDYEACSPLRIDHGVAIMEALPNAGLVRYDGLSGHTLDLLLREVRTAVGMLQYLEILRTSPHLHVYSNRPHLEHARFHAEFGAYPEGIGLGQTEEAFAWQVKRAPAYSPTLLALENGIARAFDHIGHSRQGTAEDVVKA
jgi:hypothetical protein